MRTLRTASLALGPGGRLSRRRALSLMAGGAGCLYGGPAPAERNPAVRLAISETLVTDVNINDARAAMLIWIKRMMEDLDVVVELIPGVFDTTEGISRRLRQNQLDSVALNILEYRQLADILDPSQILAGAGSSGQEQYVLLVKRSSGVQQLGQLRGRRLCTLKAPKMCIAPAWLSTILNDAQLGPSEHFFASVTSDSKVSRVVLPVFFGQVDACLASRHGFETMCELNPQVARDLMVLASSPEMVVSFYLFHKNFRLASRDRFIHILSDVTGNTAGRQLATLFQFEQLTVRDASCLSAALALLDKAERVRNRPAPAVRKG